MEGTKENEVTMITKEIEEKLKEPFAQEDVEFRIARVFKNNQRAVVLAYITSRAVMDRLDQTFGINGWTDYYQVLDNGVVCKLSVKINDEWISKQDTAPFTNIEALKGGFADALKRAAVKLGIGRYLYNLPEYYVDLHRERPYNVDEKRIHSYYSKDASGYWIEPSLPNWAVKTERQAPAKQMQYKQEAKQEEAYDEDIPGGGHEDNCFLSVEELPNDRVELQVILNNYVNSLMAQKALTEKKRKEYLSKINQVDASIGLLKYFYKQFTLIDKLFSLIRIGNVTEEERIEIYRSIMRANNSKLTTIEEDLNQKAA